jgi:ribulose-phosphate 3-epimerase
VIRDGGAEAGVALNPTTPPETLEWTLSYLDFILVLSVDPGFGGQSFLPEAADKSRRLKEMTGLPIAVDGGITVETAPVAAEAGASALVAGSAVFEGDPTVEMRRIIEAGQVTGPSC